MPPLPAFSESRSFSRRRTYLGEGFTFALLGLEAEAIDFSPGGVGLVVTALPAAAGLPAPGDTVTVRYTGPGTSGAPQQAVVRHVGVLRSGARVLPRLGLELVPEPRPASAMHRCPAALPAFASAASPWSSPERLCFRIRALGAAGMTVTTAAALPPRAELAFDLHLPLVGVERARARLAGAHGDAVEFAWIDQPHEALAQYLLRADPALTPAALRASGLAAGSAAAAVVYDYAGSPADHEAILALRLRAHHAEGHLRGRTIADLRSPFDAYARHLTCRFAGRIVGYVRVIFVEGVPARSQYVTLGGHEVPSWLWEQGFVEAGAGAMDPEFQRAGLFRPLMRRAFDVAVRSGHRWVLGACEDGLLAMYRSMGFELLEQRTVEPKPGWRFRSHLMYADAAA
jgi:GNAT superfamily N-acetyltransferase